MFGQQPGLLEIIEDGYLPGKWSATQPCPISLLTEGSGASSVRASPTRPRVTTATNNRESGARFFTKPVSLFSWAHTQPTSLSLPCRCVGSGDHTGKENMVEVVTPHLQVHHRKASVLPFRVCPPDVSSQEDRRQSTSITPLNVVEVEVPAWLPTSTPH